MEAKLQIWGNSDGIRIPNSFLKLLNLKTNDILDITYENDKIIITKPKKVNISLAERFEKYNGENLAKEFSWDEWNSALVFYKVNPSCLLVFVKLN